MSRCGGSTAEGRVQRDVRVISITGAGFVWLKERLV
jgi:hypothetical protein